MGRASGGSGLGEELLEEQIDVQKSTSPPTPPHDCNGSSTGKFPKILLLAIIYYLERNTLFPHEELEVQKGKKAKALPKAICRSSSGI